MKIKKLFSRLLAPAAAIFILTACEGEATDSIKSIYDDDVNSSSVVEDREKAVKQKLINKKWSVSYTDNYNNVIGKADNVFFTPSNSGMFYSSADEKILMPFTYEIHLNKIILSLYNGSELTFECHLNVLFGNDCKLMHEDVLTSSDQNMLNKINDYFGKLGTDCAWFFDNNSTLYVYGRGRLTEKSPNWQNLKFNNLYIDGITEIGDCIFENLYISKLVLPSSLQRIGKNAFRNIRGNADVHLPASLVEIDDNAFCNASLDYLYFYDKNRAGIKRIGAGAFAGTGVSCTESFPSTLRVIGKKAFYNAQIRQPDFNFGIEEIGDSAFNNIHYSYSDLFLPNSLKKIGKAAFNGYLGSIYVGSGLKFIPEGAFIVQSYYGDIYINQTTPPAVSGNIIYGSSNTAIDSNFTLHVPRGCAGSYMSDKYWSGFRAVFDDI